MTEKRYSPIHELIERLNRPWKFIGIGRTLVIVEDEE